MTAKTCSIAGCDRAHCARGLCRAHYQRAWAGSDVTGPIRSYTLGRYVEPEPPCCVCDWPWPDTIGECKWCARPYRPALVAVRDAWRRYLTDLGFSLDNRPHRLLDSGVHRV